MVEKKTLSGRVPADTEERFEEFRMRRGLNKTDAMRRLIEEGLDSYEATTENGVPNSTGEDSDSREEVAIGPLTQSEKWFSNKGESALAFVFLSAPATMALFVAFIIMQSFMGMTTADLPLQALALLISIGIALFSVSAVVAGAAWLAVKTGLARRLDRSSGDDEKEAAAG